MAEYKLGKVYTFLDREEAQKFIGKKGFFCDTYSRIMNEEYLMGGKVPSVLIEIDDNEYPYRIGVNGTPLGRFQFFRPILEEEPRRMTWAELMEWLARGNGMVALDCNNPWWTANVGCSEGEVNKEVNKRARIRYFGTDEILVPTREIFLKDCRS